MSRHTQWASCSPPVDPQEVTCPKCRGLKWDSYRDEITKATVYTLTVDGERWSPQTHMEYHGIQVFGERKAPYCGASKELRYFPVIRYDAWGESEASTEHGFKSVTDAKDWAIRQAVIVGLIKGRIQERAA